MSWHGMPCWVFQCVQGGHMGTLQQFGVHLVEQWLILAETLTMTGLGEAGTGKERRVAA